MKVCGKGPDTQNKQVCVITKDGRLENGMPVAIVQLFEPEGGQKVLRVTVPLGMQLSHGTRMLIDQGQPAQSPYSICFPVGCMADYQVTDDLIGKMKKGQNIIVQAINMQGHADQPAAAVERFCQSVRRPGDRSESVRGAAAQVAGRAPEESRRSTQEARGPAEPGTRGSGVPDGTGTGAEKISAFGFRPKREGAALGRAFISAGVQASATRPIAAIFILLENLGDIRVTKRRVEVSGSRFCSDT